MRLITTLLILFAVFSLNGCNKAPETTEAPASEENPDKPIPTTSKTEEVAREHMLRWAERFKLDPNKLKFAQTFRDYKFDIGKDWHTKADPEAFIKESNFVLYTVVSIEDEQNKFSLHLYSWEGDWRFLCPVPPHATGHDIRQALVKETGLAENEFFRVSDYSSYPNYRPPFPRNFVAYRQKGKLWLAPVVHEPKLGLNKGKPLPAEIVFETLHIESLREGR
ncbi:MAG: hypothetical protein K2W82_17960 [Candidatus Obscuribacterales bacterium]|nr:hypothetical protein [Candidatus Obscuribacterales bacterium]